MKNTWQTPLLIVGVITLMVGFGCGGDKKGGSFFSNEPPPPPPRRRGVETAASSGASAGPPRLIFREEDFVETELSRDPFRSFAKVFSDENKSTARTQREVVLDRYAIDELKLIGIVTGTTRHRAMLVDPTGTGWIVYRGQFIGKAELVRAAGTSGASYELNWRVDRIRDGDIVLVREDPAHSDIPAATRVLKLRPEDTTPANR
ncbi:MAG: pilus assembly protein PilP [Sorangium cellulosum]|nr:MAG: pilus assembly protein PilP [Sorangium cellulosum]